ncbi:uncharacterized protein BXZ73DRAFT_41392, partial [Epithele typhae]|uniref:uncharacterized protein n=1 Tax=Epithele typhae TaxID=378194 RepID=UPI002007C9B0
ARSHNLKVHVESVHKGLRKNRCTEPGCTKSFSRQHDLARHIVSKHTDLGSPRRKDADGKTVDVKAANVKVKAVDKE